MLTDDQIAQLQLDVQADNKNISLPCPSCKKGRFSAVKRNGWLLWNCFSPSCQERGKFPSRYAEGPQPPVASIFRPYTGEIHALDEEEELGIFDAFYLTPSEIEGKILTNGSRFVLPVFDPMGKTRGHILRTPWAGTGRMGYDTEEPKSLTYKAVEGPMLSWYPASVRYDIAPWVVLVEDQISAMKLAAWKGFTTVALMGTGVNEEKLAEIQRHGHDVILALDKDATGQAFAHARKYASAFRSFRVLLLQKDIKNMTAPELDDLMWSYAR